MSLQIQFDFKNLQKHLKWSDIKHRTGSQSYIKRICLKCCQEVLLAKWAIKTDITVCVIIADNHILQVGGKNFFKYTAPLSCLQGYCHISRMLGGADHTLERLPLATDQFFN